MNRRGQMGRRAADKAMEKARQHDRAESDAARRRLLDQARRSGGGRP